MAINKRKRIIIADDHDMVRQGLAMFIKIFDDLELVAEARDGREAVRLCAIHRPDVVLMDLHMPEMDGIAATQYIRSANPQTCVIALSSTDDTSEISAVVAAGAVDCLHKRVAIDKLVRSIRTAAHK